MTRLLLADPTDPWWDDGSTSPAETAEDIIQDAVLRAHEELIAALGDEPSDWRWGDLHLIEFENQPLGQSGIALIEALFNRTPGCRVGGGSSIVNATSWLANEAFRARTG